MSQTEQQEQEIEISILEAKEAVERRNQINRLIRDKDFQNIFTEGYFEKEPARLVSLLADGDWQTPERQESLMKDMHAISSLRQYIMNIRALGNQMEQQIANSEAVLEELRNANDDSEEEGY